MPWLCLAALGRWAEALVCYEQAVKYDENDVWKWHNYGEALIYLDRPQEAVKMLEHAIAIDPHHEPSQQKLQTARDKLKIDE